MSKQKNIKSPRRDAMHCVSTIGVTFAATTHRVSTIGVTFAATTRRVSTIILALAFMGLSATAQNYVFPAIHQGKNIYYHPISANTVEVVENYYGTAYAGPIVIPETVTNNNITYTVTTIGDGAFAFNSDNVTAITLPNTITTIKNSVFNGCYQLTTINIPTSVTSICADAFSGTAWWDNLPDGMVYINNILLGYKGAIPANTTITVQEGTTTIADYAFYSNNSNSNITAISIPASVTSIGIYAFHGTEWWNNQPDGVVYLNNILLGYKGVMPANTTISSL